MAESLLRERMQSGLRFNALLGEFLGKPFKAGATGPEAYDCYGLCRSFMARLGVELPDLGATSVEQAPELRATAEPQFLKLTWPRPWSLISLRREGDLATHCGIVLPTDGLFLHAQEKSGVVAEPITHRYWHPRIEGYYWPRDVVEVVVMHSPVGLDHSWAFFREGMTLADMLQVAEGEQSQLRVFIDGKEIERGAWDDTSPTALQQVVVRPQYGDGRTALRTIGVLALAIIMGPGGGLASMGITAANVGQFGYALAMSAVMVGGSYLFGALIPPKKPDNRQESSYGWNPQTVQREGPIPRLYGKVPVYGNIIMAYFYCNRFSVVAEGGMPMDSVWIPSQRQGCHCWSIRKRSCCWPKPRSQWVRCRAVGGGWRGSWSGTCRCSIARNRVTTPGS
jgi:hypothetical protein